ncbi:MAG: hypothetical protein O7A04_11500 [Acidobacteria bacterium]|nr:hypothetical protein [Acidobacteriota bacterium]
MNETQFEQAAVGLCTATVLVLLGCAASPSEESATAESEPPVAESPATHETVVELATAAAQIAAAVTAAPPDWRAEATVRGYAEDGELVLLRAGSNHLICLADEPSDERFQVACYHASLEPYMARGRELRAEGVTGPDSFDVRHAEIEAGTLPMPSGVAMVYNLGGPSEMHDAESGAVDEGRGRRIYAPYIRDATEASTGLSTTPPQRGAPWIMRPGTPTAHIMVVIDPETPAANDES